MLSDIVPKSLIKLNVRPLPHYSVINISGILLVLNIQPSQPDVTFYCWGDTWAKFDDRYAIAMMRCAKELCDWMLDWKTDGHIPVGYAGHIQCICRDSERQASALECVVMVRSCGLNKIKYFSYLESQRTTSVGEDESSELRITRVRPEICSYVTLVAVQDIHSSLIHTNNDIIIWNTNLVIYRIDSLLSNDFQCLSSFIFITRSYRPISWTDRTSLSHTRDERLRDISFCINLKKKGPWLYFYSVRRSLL